MCTTRALRRARTLFYNLLFPLQLRLHLRLARADRGRAEVDGSDPPFLPPGSAQRGRLMCTGVPSPGRVAPVQNIPCGKAPARIPRLLAAMKNCTLLVTEEACRGEEQGGSRKIRRGGGILLRSVSTKRRRGYVWERQEGAATTLSGTRYEQVRHPHKWLFGGLRALGTGQQALRRKVPVSEVTSADVLEILTPIWHTKGPTARIVRHRIRAVLE